MNTIALAFAVACVVASTGLAAWVWLSLDGDDDAGRGPANWVRVEH